jgi:hypothetical protein
MNIELMVIGMVLLLYGVGYIIHYTYGKDDPPTKHYDHFW